MSKWYSVELTYAVRMMVEVEDNEGEREAYEVARDEVVVDGNHFAEGSCTEITDPDDLSVFLRHADQVEAL